MKLRTDRFLVLDLEATCWRDPPAGFVPEIVEIGVVEADLATMACVRECSYLVRPKGEISPFFEELTGLTSAEVREKGRPLPEVIRTLSKAFGPGHKTLMTWGGDWASIDRQCREYGIENPFPRAFVLDAAQSFGIVAGLPRSGIDGALSALGLAFEGRRHRAVPDARNTLRIMASMAGIVRSAVVAPASETTPQGPERVTP